MSQLAWYGWLNLVGLLVLWGFFRIGHSLDETGPALRFANYLMLLIAAFFVIFNSGVSPAADAGPVLQSLAAFLLAMTAWELLASVYQMRVGDKDSDKTDTPIASPLQTSTSEPRQADDDGVLDLDAGTAYSTENQAKLQAAVTGVFRSDAPTGERLKSLGTLLSLGDDEEDEDDSAYDFVYELVGVFLVAAVLLPPCVIALQVF